jgi:GT2 family glycosyltransferase
LAKIDKKEVIVVDNKSTDGTLRMLKNWKTFKLHLVENQQNKGFAEANNQGARLATAPFVLFLNNDTYFSKDFVSPLLAFLKTHKKVAAVQPMILFPDSTIDSIGSYMTPTGFLYHRAHRMKPDKKFLKTESVYTLKGACMVWKKEVLSKIGLLDESYFAYFEETELCHRATNAGFSVSVYPEVSMTHIGGFTSNSMDQRFVQYHNMKNRIATYLRHFSVGQLFSIFCVHLLLSELLILKSFFSRPSLALSLQKGLFVGIGKGVWSRLSEVENRKNIALKSPDISYYFALFSSLQGYSHVY